MRAWTWDVFCRVIDNFGDVGVCWRLARDLAARGERVRLWMDDASALRWMAPAGCTGVEVGAFDAAGEPGDAVVEAFACDPPPAFVERMAARRPVWINLEYLSAEAWVERAHALPSPQRNGLTKWFFHPGFSAATGGLLREPGLLAERAGFERDAWLAALGAARRPGERVVSLFCYDNPAIPQLLQALAAEPTLLLLTPGHAQRQVGAVPPGVRPFALPWLDQPGFDRLLWASDLNFVRGEDSLVRAIWAGAPFVWQIYPQHDGVHADKLDALLQRLPPLPGLAAFWRGWNGLGPWAPLPPLDAWRAVAAAFRDEQAARLDLTGSLWQFARARAGPEC
ncbi:elongation factor P maturation arginine rhamnosyltransferase EarP [Rubrivivax gelatinosus]|uniref:Protein-arginine rhamnosyltransferase n=1 Tax=Rubrivivax gelatinosus TaxID=28068 RepID=A0ABS1DRU7_RUBGE|nr:elongation factor P maturation arginine rhamnosyltransferase EarP [Rubrivivax gelatinosus]MBK1712701.1 hypothetical protein [Rubrivivax gelatinosus]